MEENKNSVVVLAVSIIVLLLCITAYIFLKGKNNTVDINIQAISKDTKVVEGLNELLSKAKFVNNQKEEILKEDFDDSVNISVKIENQTIVIRALNKSVNVTSIEDPVSVSTFMVGGEDSLPVDIYVLNKKGKLYHISFYAADREKTEVKVLEFAISDVESYSTNVKDIEDHEQWINFVVAKTKDGKYYTDYSFDGDKEYTFREIKNKEEEKEDDKEKVYGILSASDVNPFKNLDFNKRIVNDAENIDFDSTSIKYTYENGDTVTFEVSDVKQVGLYCDESAGPCSELIYLTNSGNLYIINSDNGKFNNDISKAKLVSNDVKNFSLIPVIVYDIATGGEQSVIYNNTNGYTYLYDFYNNPKEITQYKKIWVDQTYDNPLYIVSKDVKVDAYLKTNKGENISAKKLFIFEGQEEDGDGDSFMYIYILNEDNYLYYTENYKKGNMELFNELKVRNVEVRDDDFVVTYINGKKETIDAYLLYEAK